MRTACVAIICSSLLFACGPGPVSPDGSVIEEDAGLEDAGELEDGGELGGGAGGGGGGGGSTGGGTGDAGLPDAGPPLTLVTVAHQRELRGVWVATVQNLDWPSSQTLSADAGRAELEGLVESMADAGINTLFFQVRPNADALYESALEPWSVNVSGQRGRSPGWDPLEELLGMAHARGIEVHAWMNPYRGLVSSLATQSITYNGIVVMNPGVDAVREHVVTVVRDVLDRYDVDGVHFDDYFYPYPDMANTPFPDNATYTAYTLDAGTRLGTDGGVMTRADWRRDNVNMLVREVMEVVESEHPHVRFGISPFGIWKAGVPVPGLDAYNVISCDAVTWLSNEWVDYLTPQLYWREFEADGVTPGAQRYSTLANWWAARLNGRHLFPGHAVYRMDPAEQNWPLSELQGQVSTTRSLRAQGAMGDVHFRTAHVKNNLKGVYGLFKNTLYVKPAVPPPLPRAGAVVAPAVPFVSVTTGALSVTSPQPQSVRSFLLYEQRSPGQWELRSVKGGAQVSFAVTSGTWAVSALGRGGGESQGVRIVVP